MSEYIHMTEPNSQNREGTVDLSEMDIYETLVLFADIIDAGGVKLELTNSHVFREAAREIDRLRQGGGDLPQ